MPISAPYSRSSRPGRPRLFQITKTAASPIAARIPRPTAFAPPAKNGSTRGPVHANAEAICASGLAAARLISCSARKTQRIMPAPMAAATQAIATACRLRKAPCNPATPASVSTNPVTPATTHADMWLRQVSSAQSVHSAYSRARNALPALRRAAKSAPRNTRPEANSITST